MRNPYTEVTANVTTTTTVIIQQAAPAGNGTFPTAVGVAEPTAPPAYSGPVAGEKGTI